MIKKDPSEEALHRLKEEKKQQIYAGEFAAVNSKRARGHKGRISKVNQNGNIEVVIVTHAPYTGGRKNIKLNENPQKGRVETSYVVTKKEIVKRKHIGKKQSDMRVKNAVDKSIFRNVAKK